MNSKYKCNHHRCEKRPLDKILSLEITIHAFYITKADLHNESRKSFVPSKSPLSQMYIFNVSKDVLSYTYNERTKISQI